MHHFTPGANSSALPPPPPQRQQPQVVLPCVPHFGHPQKSTSIGLGNQAMQDAFLWRLNPEDYHQWSDTHGGSANAGTPATAAVQLWSTLSHFYSTLPTPDAQLLESSGVHSCDSVIQHPSQQPYRRLCTMPVQSCEHSGGITTTAANPSQPLQPQRQPPLPASILGGEPLLVYFDGTSYSPFTLKEAGPTSQPTDVNQQQYYHTSHRSVSNPSKTGGTRHAPSVPASLPQHPLQKPSLSSNAWASATTAPTVWASAFTSSSARSPRTTTSTGHSRQICRDAVSSPRDVVSAPALLGDALSVSNPMPMTHSAVPQSSRTGKPGSGTAQPIAHAIVMRHSSMNRSTTSTTQPPTAMVHTSLHGVTDANAPSFPGTAYFFEAAQGESSLGINSEHSSSSPLTVSSRQPPPLEEYRLQSAEERQQQQQQRVYPRIIAHNGPLKHFFTPITAPGTTAQSSSSLMSCVASLTSFNSSAAGVVRSRELQQTSIANSSSYSDLDIWHQQPPMISTALPAVHARTTTQPSTSSQPQSQERGIARRNRDKAVLFVGQLSYEATEADVSQVFSCYGKPLSVMVLKDKGKSAKKGGAAVHRKQPKNSKHVVGSSAFVTYPTTLEADLAIMSLHNRFCMDNRDKPVQVSYCQKTDIISDFGYRHALQLHSENPANPIPTITPTPSVVYAIKFA
ncbi:hypothetical protein JKF63_02168 [Porcisia hertigi]|uniref:RRM domain-containing protein n=1 Tax=Porcisia hertigi TaxID=2761500 RepID=A0A836IGV6_9TRYP|nr:hypothetical protein JKF63_02168 [Porcisia hertigi]